MARSRRSPRSPKPAFCWCSRSACFIEAARRLAGHSAEPVEASWPVFAVLIVSILVDAVRFLSLSRIAKATRSDALAADALHFSSDLFASIVVLLGLVAARYGYQQGDSIAALGVALFIAVAGFRLGQRTIDTLVDAAPKGLSARVREVTKEVPGVVGIEVLRLRPAGAQVHGELSIAVPRTMPLELVTRVREAVAAALATARAGTRRHGDRQSPRRRHRNRPRTRAPGRRPAARADPSRDGAADRRGEIGEFRCRTRRAHAALGGP